MTKSSNPAVHRTLRDKAAQRPVTSTLVLKEGVFMDQAVMKNVDEKFCSDCGSVIKIKAEICPKCGIRQMAAPSSIDLAATAPNGKSKLAAALFALFLGGIGIHKFYLGQVGWGIAYLLFCWTFIPAIVAFVEAILLFVMSNEKFNRKFGQT